MSLCRFSQQMGCTECNYPSYSRCGKFVKARTAYQVEALGAFQKVSLEPFRSMHVYSSDVNRAKTAAAIMALCGKQRRKVMTFSFNQMFDYVANCGSYSSDAPVLTDYVLYIDIQRSEISNCQSDTPSNIFKSFVGMMQRRSVPCVFHFMPSLLSVPEGVEHLKPRTTKSC